MSFGKAVDLLRLAMMATGRTGVTLSEVEQEFCCVRRTAQRMIAALQEAFPATDHYIGSDGHHYWRVPSRAIASLLTPSADELAALGTAYEQLERAGLTDVANKVRSVKEKVRALIPEDQSARIATDEEALLEALGYAAKPGPQASVDIAIKEVIADALKGCCRLEITYQSRGDQTSSVRKIEPLGLLLGGRQYLVAIDTAKQDGRFRHYRVEDITEAKLCSEAFSPPDDFDLESYAKKAFGSFHNQDEYGEVVWRFAPHAADRVHRYQFHPDQIATKLDDGSVEVRFLASGHLEMAWHLYAWGDAVEVIEPAALAKIVHPARRADFPALP